MVLVTEPAATETADVVAGELGPVLSAGGHTKPRATASPCDAGPAAPID